jgi:hypothetical protein
LIAFAVAAAFAACGGTPSTDPVEPTAVPATGGAQQPATEPAADPPAAATAAGGDPTTVGVTASVDSEESATDATPPEPPPPPLVPGDGTVRIGDPELARGGGRVNGGIFRRQLDRKRAAITTCYNVGLGRDPELEGDLTFILVVDTQGMVGAEVEEDDPAFSEAGVTACVVGKLRQVDFDDTPPSSELRVRVPIQFEP